MTTTAATRDFGSYHQLRCSMNLGPASSGPAEGAMNKPIQGYVRAAVPLNVLDTALHKSSSDASVGFLDISTEDGVLRLAISIDAARDLRIDLNQLLGEE